MQAKFGLHFLLQINYQKSDKGDRDRCVGFECQLFLEEECGHKCADRHRSALTEGIELSGGEVIRGFGLEERVAVEADRHYQHEIPGLFEDRNRAAIAFRINI